MIGAYASLLILLAAALAVGQALLAFAAGATRADREPVSWLSPAAGLATLMVVAGIAARLPGHGVTAAVAIAVVTLVSLAYVRGRVEGIGAAATLALPVIVITTLAASLPFALAGHVGVLGAGLVNDDMASHLVIADYVTDPSGYVPSFVRGGYPIGPHAVVVGLSQGLGAGLIEVFAGFTMALAPLLGILALGLLDGLSRVRRVIGASLVALPYLGAAYLAQGAFKEPIQALLLIGFALALGHQIGLAGPLGARESAQPPLRRVLPLGLFAAAAVFNYSLPGLLWVGAVGAALVAVRWLLVKPRPVLPADWKRRSRPYALGGFAVVAIATAQEWSRIADFARLDALNPDRFGSDLGNLHHSISPLEALGVWPSGEYRISAADAGLPAFVFYAGAAVALAALVLGIARARREKRLEIPAALAAIGFVWVITALFSTPYIAAKALAIAAPLVMAIALGGVLSARRGPALALGAAMLALGGVSSFLALRQAPVAPSAHADQLAQVRDAVQGDPVLFLGRDDFIAWELRGSDAITGIVTNYYDVEDARSRFQKGEGGGEKFDVDAVFPQTLDDFRWILATTGGPQSSPPPRFRAVVQTPDYVLYERLGLVGRRKTLDEGVAPGAVLDCNQKADAKLARGKGTAQVWTTEPVVGGPERWQPSAEPSDGSPVSQTLKLGAGRWLLSLEYDSRRPLHISAPAAGLDAEVAANLDFRGESPYFPVGEIKLDRPTPVTVTAEVAQPNALARLLRAPNEAHLRSLSATPLGVIERVQRRQMCGRYVDWYRAR